MEVLLKKVLKDNDEERAKMCNESEIKKDEWTFFPIVQRTNLKEMPVRTLTVCKPNFFPSQQQFISFKGKMGQKVSFWICNGSFVRTYFFRS